MDEKGRVQFWRDSNQVLLMINPMQSEKMMKAVVIHELGEADYIANRLPYITVEFKGEYVKKLNECLSHWHINKVIKEYNLEQEVEPISKCKPEINLGANDAQNLICLMYEISTRKDRMQEIMEAEYSEKYREDLEKIIGHLNKYDTMNTDEDTIKLIEQEYEKIIDVVKQRDFIEEIILCSWIERKPPLDEVR